MEKTRIHMTTEKWLKDFGIEGSTVFDIMNAAAQCRKGEAEVFRPHHLPSVWLILRAENARKMRTYHALLKQQVDVLLGDMIEVLEQGGAVCDVFNTTEEANQGVAALKSYIEVMHDNLIDPYTQMVLRECAKVGPPAHIYKLIIRKLSKKENRMKSVKEVMEALGAYNMKGTDLNEQYLKEEQFLDQRKDQKAASGTTNAGKGRGRGRSRGGRGRGGFRGGGRGRKRNFNQFSNQFGGSGNYKPQCPLDLECPSMTDPNYDCSHMYHSIDPRKAVRLNNKGVFEAAKANANAGSLAKGKEQNEEKKN